ncbi:MAG: hypothetical protein HKM93_15130 [Desulfobacteraceae bacterium]|nr:hypothetical protein [Desulfobacteraceae bacterium]
MISLTKRHSLKAGRAPGTLIHIGEQKVETPGIVLTRYISDELEEEITENPRADTLQTIHNLRRQVIYRRKQVWPIREVVNTLGLKP